MMGELPLKEFDLLTFCYNGNAGSDDPTNVMFVLRGVNEETSISYLSDMEMAGYSINGAIQLAPEQTHFQDTSILAPTRFLVTNGDGVWQWLHDVPEWPTMPISGFLEAHTY